MNFLKDISPKNLNLALPKYVFFFNYCCCGKNCFQYFVNVYWAMLKGCAQYISMGWDPSILDLITIFVCKFGGFESTYFTLTLFDMIGICKHEKATLTRNTGFIVIGDWTQLKLQRGCINQSQTPCTNVILFNSALWFTFHSIFQKIIWPIWRYDSLNVHVCTSQY